MPAFFLLVIESIQSVAIEIAVASQLGRLLASMVDPSQQLCQTANAFESIEDAGIEILPQIAPCKHQGLES